MWWTEGRDGKNPKVKSGKELLVLGYSDSIFSDVSIYRIKNDQQVAQPT